jgi:hypothetical protein
MSVCVYPQAYRKYLYILWCNRSTYFACNACNIILHVMPIAFLHAMLSFSACYAFFFLRSATLHPKEMNVYIICSESRPALKRTPWNHIAFYAVGMGISLGFLQGYGAGPQPLPPLPPLPLPPWLYLKNRGKGAFINVECLCTNLMLCMMYLCFNQIRIYKRRGTMLSWYSDMVWASGLNETRKVPAMNAPSSTELCSAVIVLNATCPSAPWAVVAVPVRPSTTSLFHLLLGVSQYHQESLPHLYVHRCLGP